MFKKLLLIAVLGFSAIGTAQAFNVNTATPKQLEAAHGIGPVLKDNILAARANGDFKDSDDFVARVDGIGKRSVERLIKRNNLTFGPSA